MLSLVIAAVVAASIPFAAIYGKTVQASRPAYVTSAPTSAGPHTTTRLVTTASGRTVAQTAPAGASGGPAGAGSAASIPAIAPLTSRSS